MLGLAHLGWSLNDTSHLIPNFLRQYGYRSTLAGLQHVASSPYSLGYDEVLPHRTTSASDVAPVAVRFLSSQPKQPFFLDVGFFETHREFPDPVDNPNYIQPPFPLPDNEDTRRDMAGFLASARNLDRGVGLVLDALDTAGLAENTLVISTTDHGIAFPDMKCDLRDTGTGVSMMMRGPGVFSGGKVCDALISQIDIFPTLCEYLGVDKPNWLEGSSFLSVLEGRQQQINDAVFAEVTYHAAYEPKRSVRTNRWKYVRHFDGRSTAVLPNCDDGLSKDCWVRKGWKDTPMVAAEELYDLVFDPMEHMNLAKESRAQTKLVEMRAMLKAWMQRTNDPLLHGPVPLIQGGRAVDPDAYSPKELARYEPPER
jgi:arylsulfatase A-like enzyme